MENNTKTIDLVAHQHITKDIIKGLQNTKVLKLQRFLVDDKNKHITNTGSIDVTTWSMLLREMLTVLVPFCQETIDKLGCTGLQFRSAYAYCLTNLLDEYNMRPNINFSKELFVEGDYETSVTSTVYRSSPNSKIKIITDENGIAWYACAVYTGEVIWLTEALLDTISFLNDKYRTANKEITKHYNFTILYTNRTVKNELGNPTVEEAIDPEVEVMVDKVTPEIGLLQTAFDLRSTLVNIYNMAVDCNYSYLKWSLDLMFKDMPEIIRKDK